MCGGGFAVTFDRVEPQFDTGREHEAVVGQGVTGRQRDAARLGIDGGGGSNGDLDAGGGDLVVAELLLRQLADAAEYAVAQRRRRIGGPGLDQGDRQLGVG